MLINFVFLLALAAGSTWATVFKTMAYTVPVPVWDVSGSYARLVKVLRAPSYRWSIHQKYFQLPEDHSHDYHDESDTWSNETPVFLKPMHLFNYRHRKATPTTTTTAPITKPTPIVASFEETTMNPMMEEIRDELSTDAASLPMKKKHKRTESKLSFSSHSASLLCSFSRRLCHLPDDMQLVKLQQPLVFAAPGSKFQSQRYFTNAKLSPRHVPSMFY